MSDTVFKLYDTTLTAVHIPGSVYSVVEINPLFKVRFALPPIEQAGKMTAVTCIIENGIGDQIGAFVSTQEVASRADVNCAIILNGLYRLIADLYETRPQ